MQLKSMVVRFYSDLLETSNTSIQSLSIRQIQCIHPFRCPSSLSAIPTEEEIRSMVFSLPRNKALSPNGFTVEFFTSSCNLVGPNLIYAVKSFFTSSKMLR